MTNKPNFKKNNHKKAGSSGFQKITEPAPKRDSVLESLLHSEHTVEIEKMAVGGDGVARITYKDKKLVVFVSKSAPKDVLKIKITQAEKSFLFGSIVEIITPGPSRRTPPCEYAPVCGGCSWQQISDEEQLLQKEILLKELFAKSLPTVKYNLEETVQSPSVFNYRNRIQLKSQNGLLGYFEDKSHTLVDINYCLIAEKRISDDIPVLKASLKSSDQLVKYELKINQNDKFEHNRIGQKGEGLSFSQVNTGLNQLLVSCVLDLVSKTNAKNITELYAGSGNFSFELIKNNPFLAIEAVEMNSDLTANGAKKVAQLNLQKKLTFFTADCDSYVKRRALSTELILLDPPRAGCSDIVLKKVAEQAPKDIIYISCHPVSLVRDLQKLGLGRNNYQIQKLQIFNMFPQTDHFETIIWLTKNQS
ncbi:MAG: class I SAM-dependent RNA methyltransferase [Bdellovibrio sp.]|nr:class I SAM-dependent RNA methyltransferase [Bdellovibrio sp.]